MAGLKKTFLSGRRLAKGALRMASAASAHLGWHARPDFLIIGAEKGGTSALHFYLAAHPDISPSFDKEIFFFSPESHLVDPGLPGYERYARILQSDHDPVVRREMLRWYHSQFRVPIPGWRKLHYESSPGYLFFPKAAARIHAYRPDMRLIALLRDPVERAFSSWNMAHGWSDTPAIHDERSFEDAISIEMHELDADPVLVKSYYLRQGLYYEQLSRYFELFPREQMLILESRDLLVDRDATFAKVCDFLGVRQLPAAKARPPMNVGTYGDELSEEMRQKLAQFYSAPNRKLFDLIGRKFAWTEPVGP